MTPPGRLAEFSATNAIGEIATERSYQPATSHLIAATPYHRPLDGERLARIDWDRPLGEQDLISDESLIANRLLMNLYESDALFLPSTGLGGREREFENFYSGRARINAEIARPVAESYVFGSLDAATRINGHWDCDALEAHILTAIKEAVSADRPVLRAIEDAVDPLRAAEMTIAQMALDGLTEATAMSQNLGGAYGVEQSKVFKIFVDEFGYGVFDAKRSTLFAKLCDSVGMNVEPHHYWFFYLPTWIAANNYFYKVTRNRTEFFRYIGGMAFLEATFAPSFAAMTKTFRSVYGDQTDTRYFDEHAHIDQHHGRMAVNDLLLPLARKHGEYAIRELVRGIEDVRVLGRLGDEDLLRQISWEPTVVAADGQAERNAPQRMDDTTPFETKVSAEDMTVSVLRGVVEFHWTATCGSLQLHAGEGVRVPKGRLYGLAAKQDSTVAFTADRDAS
jgi:hypothetical protein